MMFMANTNSSRNMAMMPARPGFLVESFDSSLRFVAVSQPQKKKTPSTMPADSALIEPMWNGLSQPTLKPREPAGWETATLTIPQIEKPMTATYSMMSNTHWKLVVQRIPQMQMKVMMASQMPATTAAVPTDPAVESEIQPHPLRSCSVYWPATMGAEMQNRMLVATWTHPLNQPTYGLTSLDSHA